MPKFCPDSLSRSGNIPEKLCTAEPKPIVVDTPKTLLRGVAREMSISTVVSGVGRYLAEGQHLVGAALKQGAALG